MLVWIGWKLIAAAYLRLNGIDAREHAVFRELTRVKQYFQKVEDVEKMGSRRENLSLDKAAAGRIIKHALVSTSFDTNRNPLAADLGLVLCLGR